MKHLKLYENYQPKEEITKICEKYGIQNWSINSEGLVDVDGNVVLTNKGLIKLPLKFGKVTGYFFCYNNKLVSLKGAPNHVGLDFYCYNNKLVSLEGGPNHVGRDFSCSDNKLVSLEGAPSYVGDVFYCYNNKLVSLEGAPNYLGGGFSCNNNLVLGIWNLFNDYSKIELFNDYDPIRMIDGKPAIIFDRLNSFLEDIGKPKVKSVNGYINV